MTTRGPSKGITAAQLMGILAFTLALFFVVSFGTKTVEAYRLRSWRDRLQSDIAEMERERALLHAEIERRQSMAWVDKVLRASGYVPEGVMRVIITQAESMPSEATAIAQELPASASAPEAVPETAPRAAPRPSTAVALWSGLFDGSHWEAWQRLIWGFDEDIEPGYNGER
jgi:hypothetical protein